ncbi:hypothetical protein FDG50_12640 [Clostridium botulinum]|uniref:hypothetical protein n=1 Tax=Clostridium botulinum TaxID=1491 RepID=UPI001400595C|nr:hypothetical protein [Clostridium botulinum]MBY6837964.1 hypothetical protein [Clostridium botulinum]NFG63809.1 hypothetical protein [Clostridium botulinum]NFQ24956.1 hypothetical protein [Clostridium botulinum]
MKDRFRRRLKNEEFTMDGCENHPIKSSKYGSEADLRTVNNQIISKINSEKKINLKIIKNHQF